MVEKVVNTLEDRQIFLWSLSLVTVFVIALLLRVAAIGVMGQDFEWEEWGVIAERIVAGDGYSYRAVTSNGDIVPTSDKGDPLPSAYMPPGYAFFILPFVFLGGTSSMSLLFLQLVQAVLGALTCVFVFKLSKKFFGATEAVISASILSFYPLHVYLSTQVSSANLYIFLGLLSAFFIYKWEEGRRIRELALIGIFIGLLSLTRAQAVLFIPVAAGWVAIKAHKERYAKSFLVVVLSLAMILPWSYRNYSTFHEFVPVAESAGYNLWRGHNLGTRGAWNDSLSAELRRKLSEIERTKKDYGSVRDSLFREYALKYISEDPSRSVKLTAFKFVYFWGYFWGVEKGYPGVDSPLYWLPWFLLLPFFLVGVYLSRKRWKELIILYLFMAIPSVVVTVFFVLPRYRLFIVPFVSIFAAFGALKLQGEVFGNEEK